MSVFAFFSFFRLPDAAAGAVAAWQHEQLAVERVRIVPVENLHVTIAFLGSRPADEIGAIAGALRESVLGESPARRAHAAG